jgi:hypothetical protein
MLMLLTWTLLSDHLLSINAAPTLHLVLQETPGVLNNSDGLSVEALLTLIGVCVAVLGIALTLVLKWSSLKVMCLARRCHHRSRSRRNDPGEFSYIDRETCSNTDYHAIDSAIHLVGLSRRSSAPLSSIDDVSDDQIARPLRVQTCPAEQQRVLLRTRTL